MPAPMRGDVAIACRGVTKRFYHYDHRTTSLTELVVRTVRGRPLHVRHPKFELVGLDLEVARGESVALIGSNGSGKSTALRLMAGIYPPTTGSITCSGRVVAVIELGSTFQPDLTGAENLRLYSAALGLTRQEIVSRRDEVFDFAGVEEFADVPLKYYSSGMRSRLAFAIAANAAPDILLLDEVMAVGDEEFRARCYQRLAEHRARGGTMVVVSHDLESIGAMCDRAVWLDHGAVRMDGATADVVQAYAAQWSEP